MAERGKTAAAKRGRPPKRRDIPIRLTEAVPVKQLVRGFLDAGPHPGDAEKVRKAKTPRTKRA